MTLSVERAWNTWIGSVAGNMVHLPSGFALRVSIFDGDIGSLEDFRDALARRGSHIELGAHTMRGELVEFLLAHGNSHISVSFAKATPFLIVGHVDFKEVSEWNPHKWVNLEVGYSSEFPQPEHSGVLPAIEAGSRTVRLEPHDGSRDVPMISSRWRSQEFRVTTSVRPTSCDVYPSRADLEEDYEARGAGFVRPASNVPGTWAAFRFNLEGVHSFSFTAAQSADGTEAACQAVAAIDDVSSVIARERRQAELPSEAVRAVRDVVAWNTVWDPVVSSPYTCLTRNWLKNLDGRSIWLTDVSYNAFLAATAGEWELAHENLDEVLSGQQANGLVPGLMAGSTEWVDRTQFPVLSYITWRTHLITGNVAKLIDYYPALRRYQLWQYACRDGNRNGLLEHGSQLVGLALNAGTRWAAINESGMDNLPVFDDAVYDPTTQTLDFEEVGHNSFLVLGFEMLANMAMALGLTEDARHFSAERERVSRLVQTQLWDEDRRIFAGRLWSGKFATHLSPTSFYPLIAGIATEEQASILIKEHLLNPEEFWGEIVIPTTPRSDPVAADNAYWRGRVWPPLNFFVWDGLRRYGYWEEASELAARSWELFNTGWSSHRHAHENFQMSATDRCDWPNSDEFYSWGAMMPLMAALEMAEASPWHGVTLVPGARPAALRRPGEDLSLETDPSTSSLILRKGSSVVCSVTGPRRLTDISIEANRFALRAETDSATPRSPISIRIPSESLRRLIAVLVDGQTIDIGEISHNGIVSARNGERSTHFEVILSPRPL